MPSASKATWLVVFYCERDELGRDFLLAPELLREDNNNKALRDTKHKMQPHFDVSIQQK